MKKLIFTITTLFIFIQSANAANIPIKVITENTKELFVNIKGGYEFMTAYETYSEYYNEWYPAKQEMEFFQKLRKMKINATNTSTLSYTKEKILSVRNTCTNNVYVEEQLRVATKNLNDARNHMKKNSKNIKIRNLLSKDMTYLMTTTTAPRYFLALDCPTISKQADVLISEIDKKLQ